MGKPRMIILIRHAQSEGNKNRDIHQSVPDHRVRLTSEGRQQSEEAGRRLRGMLRPDDTLQFFTSPYRRTRETTEGILRSLTSEEPGPSPFPRHKIKVYEEPRLREQDFGNFQPCSAEMERMWQERADYGHFFYRIPNGESAADAYDRISGFNESMWRLFADADFPSVCVLVTHGLMTRVFLMKWYHWSVEYFEDLRNVNHCEFIIMKQNPENGKYVLQNQLRTWSDLKRRAAAAHLLSANVNNVNNAVKTDTASPTSPPLRRWGGCVNGCDHAQLDFPRRFKRQSTTDLTQLSQPAIPQSEKEDNPIASQEAENAAETIEGSRTKTPSPVPGMANSKVEVNGTTTTVPNPQAEPVPDMKKISEAKEPQPDRPSHGATNSSSSPVTSGPTQQEYQDLPEHEQEPSEPFIGRDAGGSLSGAGTPFDCCSEKGESCFDSQQDNEDWLKVKLKMRNRSSGEWMQASGMGMGAQADALGDGAVKGEEDTKSTTPVLDAFEKYARLEDFDTREEEFDVRRRESAVGLHEIERAEWDEKRGFKGVY